MELKLNSFNSKLYRWFYYKSKDEMPKSLCPYFWQLLIMYVFIIPYSLIALPYLLFNKRENESFVAGIFGSFFIYGFLFIVFTMISSIILIFFGALPTQGFWLDVCFGGLMLWLITIIISVYHLIKFLV